MNGDAPERRLILSYTRAEARAGWAALLALDDTLAAILRTTREPMVGQMRLTWWHGAISALDDAPPPAQPVLQALAAQVVPHVRGTTLAAMADGWEQLLASDPLPDDALTLYADGRGGTLFRAAALVAGAEPGEPLAASGRAWALDDLAVHSRSAALAKQARRLASEARAEGVRRWPTDLRGLGAMSLLARQGSPSPMLAMGRLLLLRSTGI